MPARTAEETDWPAIVRLYDLLAAADPGPVIELNRAIAIGMRDGPAAGLALVEPLAAGALGDYKFAHLARADFLRRLGDLEGAKAAYISARESDLLPQERRFVEKQLLTLTSSSAA
jgi:RNA polymerase sigma-70 factor (ECF subfamily)